MSENIPIPSGYDVYWEKWVDAYESDIETIDMTHEKFEEDEKSDFGIDFQSFEEEDAIELPMKTIQTIFTPFGVLPLTEQSLASSYFKFWVGHTNFKITYSFYKIISNIEGVETLDVFSPYRFRISVGKLFRDRDVMNHIRKSMISYAKGQINEYFKEVVSLSSSDAYRVILIESLLAPSRKLSLGILERSKIGGSLTSITSILMSKVSLKPQTSSMYTL